MANKKNTRRALFTSIMALILCCAMLVGTTFAWFTDEVKSGMNTIQSGNLDVMLLANGEEVNETTKLFHDVNGKEITYWEPGVVAFENLQVKNAGTLALKYQMTLNFGNENDLDGHKLSEILKVVVLDETIDRNNITRQEVLAKAEAKLAVDQGKGALSNMLVTGDLVAGAENDKKAIVIFWAPNTAEIDNLYNANNGKTTSDGKPLRIEFGVNLQATQMMNESDSFGNNYDNFADIMPKATVNNVTADYPSIEATMGIGGADKNVPMDFALQFMPKEDSDAVKENGYKYYNVDFVVKADRDVPANSMALAGYYAAWCNTLNGGKWVALTSDETIPANTEIRLVETMGQGSIKVSYKDICDYGNDGVGFLCGAADLTGANAGTTITVELRLYETTSDPNNSSNVGEEVGPNAYVVAGTYTYTFDAAEVSNMQELNNALKAGAKEIDAKGANLGDFDYSAKFTDNTVIKNAKFTYFYGGNVEGTVTFENCEFVSDHSYSANFDSGNGKIIFNNCTFDGWSSFGTAITNVEMNNCTFNKTYNYGILRFYQNAQLKNCTFAPEFEGVDSNQTGTVVEFTNCTGIDSKIYNNGDVVGTWIVDGIDISTSVTSW